jgi:drug efflux transport system permease protein
VSALSAYRLGAVVRKELRQLLRDPRSRPILFVAPLLQLLLFGYAVSTDVRHVKTFVVDQDRTEASRALVEAMTGSGYFDVIARSSAPSDLVRALDRGMATVGLEIPPGYGADLAAGRAEVQVLLDGSDSNEAIVAQGYATLILASHGAEVAREQAAANRPPGRVTGGAGQGRLDLRARAWYNPELESRVYNVPAVIGLLLLIICLILTALSVVRERETGTLDQLLVSPISSSELMLGKTIPVLFVALIDLVVISSVGILWFSIPFRGSAFSLLAAALLFIITGLSVGLLVSTISRTQQEAFMTIFLFILPSIILSGFFFPIRSMPLVFEWLTVANPVRWFLEIVRSVFLKGSGMRELWLPYAALAVMATGALALAVARFRREIA